MTCCGAVAGRGYRPAMTTPVHAQPTADVTDERRQRVKGGADLCRARPAVWSAMVRYSDQLQRDGVERDEAEDVAWAVYVNN